MEQKQKRIVLEGVLREAVTPVGREASRRSGVREMDVVALRSGLSKNGYYYSPEVVTSLVPLLEGARAYADHPGPQDRPERSVRDLVGFYRDARVEESAPASGQPLQAEAVATLHVLESASWLWSMLREAVEQGMPGLVGVSIDVQGMVEGRRDDASGQVVNAVTRFLSLNSCDVVTRPSAGGRLVGIHREGARQGHGFDEGRWMMGETVDLKDGYYYKEYEARSRQRLQETEGREAGSGGAQATPEADEDVEALRADAQRALEAARRAQRLAECELLLGRRLSESHLPGPVMAKLRRRFENRVFEASELERAISEERETLAALAGLGLIREMGYEKPLSPTHFEAHQ